MMLQQNVSFFILTRDQKLLSMKATLMMYLNQSIIQLYQTYENILEKVKTGLLILQLVTLLIFQSTIPQLVAIISSYQKNYTIQKMINIQSINDNECFKWCLVRYLHTIDHHQVIIRKVGKLYGDKLDFKDIKFPVKIRDIHKIESHQSMRQKNVVKINILIYY